MVSTTCIFRPLDSREPRASLGLGMRVLYNPMFGPTRPLWRKLAPGDHAQDPSVAANYYPRQSPPSSSSWARQHDSPSLIHICILQRGPTEPPKTSLNGENQPLNGTQSAMSPPFSRNAAVAGPQNQHPKSEIQHPPLRMVRNPHLRVVFMPKCVAILRWQPRSKERTVGVSAGFLAPGSKLQTRGRFPQRKKYYVEPR